MAWLTEACTQRSPFLGYVDVEPAMSALIRDPACSALLRTSRVRGRGGTLLNPSLQLWRPAA